MKAASLLFLCASASLANDVYIAQNAAGGNTGADCSNAKVYTYFNSVGNWTSGVPTGIQIGPGTTVHLCGTITASAGASAFLEFQGSGSSGSPITLVFESGAILSAPYWGTDGAIASGHDYTVIDGVCVAVNSHGRCYSTQGAVIATDNGTVLGHQISNTSGVAMGGVTGVEVKNLTISGIYVHAASLSDTADGTTARAVYINGGNSVSIHDLIVNNAGNGVRYSYAASANSSGVSIYNNTIQNVNWGIVVGDSGASGILNGPVNIYNNEISDFYLWDQTNNANHHDGIYCFATNASSSLNACNVYNNYLHGDPGEYANAWIYFSQNSGGDSCGGLFAFNNVVNNTAGGTAETPANGFIQDWCTNDFTYNNTFIGLTQISTNPVNSANPGASINLGTGLTVENSILTLVRNCIGFGSGATLTSADYNIYNSCAPGWDNINTQYNTLSAWQGCHTHGCPVGSHDQNSLTYSPNLSAAFVPLTGSQAISTAMNLYSVCNGQANPGLGALCFDAGGIARPSTGPWDIGAYAFRYGASASSGVSLSGVSLTQ